jgi:hypothetical protein
MSRNGFNDCEQEYNRREEAIEMAKDQRELAEARRCPSCQNTFLQPFVCTTCGAENLYDETLRVMRVRAEQAESRAAAANDLLRECRSMLDGLEAQPLIYRIDAALGEKK